MQYVPRAQVVSPPRVVAEIDHLLRGKVREAQHGVVHAAFVAIALVAAVDQESHPLVVLIRRRPRIGNEREELRRVGVQLEGEGQRVPHGLLRLALVPHHVACMDKKARFLSVPHVGQVLLHFRPLPDVVQNPLASALYARDDEPAAGLPHQPHRLQVERVDPRVAQPAEPPVQPLPDEQGAYRGETPLVYRERVVLYDDFLHVGEIRGDVLELRDDVLRAAGAVAVAVHGLRIDAEVAAAGAAAPRENLYARPCGGGEEVVPLVQVSFYEFRRERDAVHVLYRRHWRGPCEPGAVPDAQPPDFSQWLPGIHGVRKLAHDVVILADCGRIDSLVIAERLLGGRGGMRPHEQDERVSVGVFQARAERHVTFYGGRACPQDEQDFLVGL